MRRLQTPFFLAALLLHGCAILDRDGAGADPQLVQALHREAQEAYGRDDLDRAGAVYEKILSQSEVDSETWFVIGNIHARKGDHARAVSAYRSALSINAGDARAWNNLSVIHLKDAWLAAQAAHRNSAGKEPAFINSQKIIDVLSGLTFLGQPGRVPAAPSRGGADVPSPAGAAAGSGAAPSSRDVNVRGPEGPPARPVPQPAPVF